jgi:hypothetical protein
MTPRPCLTWRCGTGPEWTTLASRCEPRGLAGGCMPQFQRDPETSGVTLFRVQCTSLPINCRQKVESFSFRGMPRTRRYDSGSPSSPGMPISLLCEFLCRALGRNLARRLRCLLTLPSECVGAPPSVKLSGSLAVCRYAPLTRPCSALARVPETLLLHVVRVCAAHALIIAVRTCA